MNTDPHLFAALDEQDRRDRAYDAVMDSDDAMDRIFALLATKYATCTPPEFLALIYAGEFLSLDSLVRDAVQAEADRQLAAHGHFTTRHSSCHASP